MTRVETTRDVLVLLDRHIRYHAGYGRPHVVTALDALRRQLADPDPAYPGPMFRAADRALAEANARLRSIRRRDAQKRYLRGLVPWSEPWRARVADIIAFLDHHLYGPPPTADALQELADLIDYGPTELSPRHADQLRQISAALAKSKSLGAAACSAGEHAFSPATGRCRHCGAPRLMVIDKNDSLTQANPTKVS